MSLANRVFNHPWQCRSSQTLLRKQTIYMPDDVARQVAIRFCLRFCHRFNDILHVCVFCQKTVTKHHIHFLTRRVFFYQNTSFLRFTTAHTIFFLKHDSVTIAFFQIRYENDNQSINTFLSFSQRSCAVVQQEGYYIWDIIIYFIV